MRERLPELVDTSSKKDVLDPGINNTTSTGQVTLITCTIYIALHYIDVHST